MTDQPGSTFAETLDSLIRNRGWSQKYVADQLGVYSADVGRWRRGKGGIGIHNVRKIARLFDVDPAMLEALAGFGDNKVGSDQPTPTVDPGIAAMLDNDKADTLQTLDGIPKAFWPVVMNAQRETRKNVAQAIRDAVSQLSEQQLAGKPRRSPNSRQGGEPGSEGKLPVRKLFAAYA